MTYLYTCKNCGCDVGHRNEGNGVLCYLCEDKLREELANLPARQRELEQLLGVTSDNSPNG